MEGEKAAARGPIPRQLTPDESRALIARNYLATLATVGEGQPYGIPLIYGFEDDQFFFVVGRGRKTRNIDDHPVVCVTICETEDTAKKWRSVLAFGTVTWLQADAAVEHALAVMKKQYPGSSTRSGGGAAALARAGFRVARVSCREITGRSQGY
jgi:nitroimidazol reductase NimA-like FMN-containing flavoprotein (pyridoxamine 5'-phosphate oxidase superfamily)